MKQKIFKSGARLLILSAIFLFPALAAAQEAQTTNENVFAAVPLKDRSSLIRDLKIYVKHYKKEDWGAVYDMMFGDKETSKEEYIKKASGNTDPKIIDFHPTFVTQKNIEYMPGADWIIIGKVTVLNNGKTEETPNGVTYAKRVKDKWYFTFIGIAQLGVKISQ